MNLIDITRGGSPVVLGFPHTGTFVPEAVQADLNDNGRLLADTDWHIHELYDGLLDDVTTVRATFHRYVIDANRDPAGHTLYPGQNTTGLVPLTDFEGHPIWQEGREPDATETARRVQNYHAPYHAALTAELDRVREIHGIAVLYDCHSIRSHIPFLFEGKLPDFNIGTDNGKTCDASIERTVAETAAAATDFTCVLNGRFRGGWTTRHYGRPAEGFHAIQMELAQSTHLAREEAPFDLDPAKATVLRSHLKAILERIDAVARSIANRA